MNAFRQRAKMTRRLTIQEFVHKSLTVHGDKYEYSSVEYVTTHTKVSIWCKIHGIFNQTPNDHMQGYGCSSCGGTKRASTDEFIKKATKIHGSLFDYSYVEYVNVRTKVKIMCKQHGMFEQEPIKHLTECRGCPTCAGELFKQRNQSNLIGTKTFVARAQIVHPNAYNYEKVNYVNAHTPIFITCPTHGDFYQTPANHLWNKNGCSQCAAAQQYEKLTYSEVWFERNPDKKVIPGILYLIRFISDNEKFLKVGITLNNGRKRFYSRHKNYAITPLLEQQMTIYDAYTAEQKILNYLKLYKYIPTIRFGGMSECLQDNELVVEAVRSRINGNL